MQAHITNAAEVPAVSICRVLVVEDHSLVRAGIVRLLEEIDHVQVIGEAGDGREALMQVERLQPDLVLMDITLPGLDGLEVTSRVQKQWPQVKVIILSMHDSKEFVLQALVAGASGYLLKDSALAELELAVRS